LNPVAACQAPADFSLVPAVLAVVPTFSSSRTTCSEPNPPASGADDRSPWLRLTQSECCLREASCLEVEPLLLVDDFSLLLKNPSLSSESLDSFPKISSDLPDQLIASSVLAGRISASLPNKSERQQKVIELITGKNHSAIFYKELLHHIDLLYVYHNEIDALNSKRMMCQECVLETLMGKNN